MITQAILSLMKHYNRVNLPTLGAIIKQRDFSETLFFNQFIKHDDGLLLTHLTKVEMLSEDEARSTVQHFIDVLQENLRCDGKSEIEGLGIFCYVDNRLELLQCKEYNLMLSNQHLSNSIAPEHPADNSIQEETLNEGITTNNVEAVCDAAEHEELVDDSRDTGSLSESLSYEAPMPLSNQVSEVSVTSNPIKSLGDSNRILKIIRASIPPIVLGLALLRLSIPIPSGKRSIDSLGVVQIDTVANISPEVSHVSQSFDHTSISHANSAVTGEGAIIYHVIIGAFRSEANADRLVADQISQGHTAFKLGKRNGYYLVSYIGTSDMGLAKKICHDLRALYPEVWLDKQE